MLRIGIRRFSTRRDESDHEWWMVDGFGLALVINGIGEWGCYESLTGWRCLV
jgi:hypothetical protein